MSRTKLAWIRNTETLARVYESRDRRFEILWDPAGTKKGEPGG